MDIEEDTQVILGSSTNVRTLADGTLRLAVDISPTDANAAFQLFGAPGSPVALARIMNEVAAEAGRPKAVKGPYGNYAKALVQSGFFRSPAVWAGCGTDEEYLGWVKKQPSALSGDFSEYHDDGEAYCIPAHVRRVEHGSGVAIKPPYSAIPLTNKEHQRAHQEGDSAVGTEEFWEKARIKFVSSWAWATLKENLGYDSYTLIPPGRIVSWANLNQCQQYLPSIFNGETEVHAETDNS